MKKEVKLVEKVIGNNGEQVATLQTTLTGDGSTPQVIVIGGKSSIIGYNDDGTVIVDNSVDEVVEIAKRPFMAKAIKEQKKLCVENGIDPNVVNILHAEKGIKNE